MHPEDGARLQTIADVAGLSHTAMAKLLVSLSE
jgi:hypothetical protein